MSFNIKISPSMLSCDFCNIQKEIECMEKAGADWLHLDIMDGIFVPNITFGMPIISAMRKHTDLFFDTHLMIDKPERYISDFIKAGSQNITIHYEACENVTDTLNEIRKNGIMASLSVKPGTDIEKIYEFLPYLDMVLVMTVEPGFGGQSFMPDMMEKIRKLVILRKREQLNFSIQVDGGINSKTILTAASAGADNFVAGSAVFNSEDRKKTIKDLKTIAENNYMR